MSSGQTFGLSRTTTSFYYTSGPAPTLLRSKIGVHDEDNPSRKTRDYTDRDLSWNLYAHGMRNEIESILIVAKNACLTELDFAN